MFITDDTHPSFDDDENVLRHVSPARRASMRHPSPPGSRVETPPPPLSASRIVTILCRPA
jgi:hypothetical protein